MKRIANFHYFNWLVVLVAFFAFMSLSACNGTGNVQEENTEQIEDTTTEDAYGEEEHPAGDEEHPSGGEEHPSGDEEHPE